MSRPFPRFVVSTCESFPGKKVAEYCGLARGNSIRSASIGTDVVARMKNLVGGEIAEYTKILAECREEAVDRMIEHARSLGANAVLGMRFCTSEVAAEAAELLAYGTAVVLQDEVDALEPGTS